MNSKGQFGSLQEVIIALVIVGIVLGIGLLLINEFKENLPTDAVTVGVEGEAITPLTAGVYVDYNYTTPNICGWGGANFVKAYNATDSTEITSGNYTFASTGLLTVVGTDYNNTNWKVNYTYNYGGTGCEAIETVEDAIGGVPTWLAIIVILIIVGILLAIVFNVLPVGGSAGGIFRRGAGGTTAEI